MPKTALICLGLLAILPACSGPEIHRPEVISVNGQDFDYGEGVVRNVVAEVENHVDDVDLEFDDVSVRLADGRLAVQFQMYNDDDEPVRLHLTWEWRDAGGIVLRRGRYETPDHYLVLRPGETRVLPFTSPTDEAIQFVIRVNHTAQPE
jgi:uncharacterized protein YcfL